jgi:hypothetical protein
MTERQRIYRDGDGVRRVMHWDDEDPDQVTVETQQDIEPILASVERDRAIMTHDGPNKVLARLPVEVYERAVLEQWDEGDWARYLNSSECEPFRIWRGRV